MLYSFVDPVSGKAAFNSRVTTPDRVAMIEHSAPTYMNPKYTDSYSSEYDGIRDLVKYMRMNDLHKKKTSIYCDNEGCTRVLNAGPTN